MDGISVNIITGELTQFVFTPTAIPIEALKVEKLEYIENARDSSVHADVSALGTMWQADQRSQELLTSAITLAQSGLPLPLTWRDSFNNDLNITSISQLLSIAGAIALQTQAAYSRSWQLKAQVAAATTEAELALINW